MSRPNRFPVAGSGPWHRVPKLRGCGPIDMANHCQTGGRPSRGSDEPMGRRLFLGIHCGSNGRRLIRDRAAIANGSLRNSQVGETETHPFGNSRNDRSRTAGDVNGSSRSCRRQVHFPEDRLKTGFAAQRSKPRFDRDPQNARAALVEALLQQPECHSFLEKLKQSATSASVGCESPVYFASVSPATGTRGSSPLPGRGSLCTHRTCAVRRVGARSSSECPSAKSFASIRPKCSH